MPKNHTFIQKKTFCPENPVHNTCNSCTNTSWIFFTLFLLDYSRSYKLTVNWLSLEKYKSWGHMSRSCDSSCFFKIWNDIFLVLFVRLVVMKLTPVISKKRQSLWNQGYQSVPYMGKQLQALSKTPRRNILVTWACLKLLSMCMTMKANNLRKKVKNIKCLT